MAPHVTYRESTKSGGRIEIDSVDGEILATVLRRMIQDGLQVIDFHLHERKLEDAFIEILGDLESSGTPVVS